MAAATSSGPLATIQATARELQSIYLKHRPELLTAATARAVSILILNPLDACKTRLQTTTAKSPLALKAVQSGPPLAGVLAGILAHAPGGIISFVAYARLCSSTLGSIAAAATADAVAALWLTPLEVAKLKVQIGLSDNMMAALKRGGHYIGFGGQVIRDATFRVLHLVMYERMCEWWKERKGSKEVGVLDGGMIGAVVGAVAGGITTPLDVVKTRVMSQRVGAGSLFEGLFACAVRTVRTEGLGGLYRGTGQRMVYMAASVALFSVAYELVKEKWNEALISKAVFVDAPKKKGTS